jgi:hypothetical protein
VFRSLVLLLAVAAGAVPAGASVRIADINMVPLVTSSSPREFVTAGNEVFFVATTPAAGVGLWKTDGTEGGTILLHGFGGIREQRFWLTALGTACVGGRRRRHRRRAVAQHGTAPVRCRSATSRPASSAPIRAASWR